MNAISGHVIIGIELKPCRCNMWVCCNLQALKAAFCLFRLSLIYVSVDGGHRAVIFDRFQGVKPDVIGEGTHFLIPWVQRPVIFDIRSRPRNVPTITGSKGIIFHIFG